MVETSIGGKNSHRAPEVINPMWGTRPLMKDAGVVVESSEKPPGNLECDTKPASRD
jgi:hypothetical protein